MWHTTAEALAAQVSQENFDKGLIYPPFTNIRKISAHIAANVAAKAYELGQLFVLKAFFFDFYFHLGIIINWVCIFVSGLATRLPQPKDLVKFAESCMYTPAYRSYRWSDNNPFIFLSFFFPTLLFGFYHKIILLLIILFFTPLVRYL